MPNCKKDNWRSYHPKDPEGLKAFIRYMFNRIAKAGYFFEKNEEKAKDILDKTHAIVFKELEDHIKSFDMVV